MSQQDSKLGKSLHEPIKISLQKELEIALSNYEEERVQELHMDIKIKEFESEINSTQGKKHAELRAKLLNKCNSLQKKIEVTQDHVNTTQNENLLIRNKIDHMRIVTANQRNKIKSLEEDIKRSKILTKLKNKEQNEEKRMEKEKLSEIRLAMSKSANEKIRYTQKLEAISTVIKKEKNSNALTLKKVNENLEGILNKELKVLDNTKLMQKLCARISGEIKKMSFKATKAKEKNEKLHELFEIIKKNSEIEKPADFVKLFLVFYDEFSNLSKYLLELLAEIESLDFTNKKIEVTCEESSNLALSSRSKASNIYHELNASMHNVCRRIKSATKHQNLIKSQLAAIQHWLLKSISLCGFLNPLPVIEESEKEGTLGNLLSVLEDLIHSLRIYTLYSRRKEFSIKSITLSPSRNRGKTPEINVISKQIREFLTNRDLIEEYPGDQEIQEKTPHTLEFLRERARNFMDFPMRDRLKTPPPRSSIYPS